MSGVPRSRTRPRMPYGTPGVSTPSYGLSTGNQTRSRTPLEKSSYPRTGFWTSVREPVLIVTDGLGILNFLFSFLDHPLANGFKLTNGHVFVTVPKDTVPGTDYAVVCTYPGPSPFDSTPLLTCPLLLFSGRRFRKLKPTVYDQSVIIMRRTDRHRPKFPFGPNATIAVPYMTPHGHFHSRHF